MADETTEAADESVDVAARGLRPADSASVLLVLGLVWLAITLWFANSNLASRADLGEAASAAALSLPTLVTGALLAGAAAGLAALSTLRRHDFAAIGRLLVGAAGGAIVGLITGGVIVIAYGTGSSIVILAGTVATAALVGGLMAALPAAVIGAGLAGTFAVLAITVLVNRYQSPLKSLLGADGSIASLYDSARTLSLVTDVLCGVAVAVVAFVYLRRQDPARHWAWYALAGALSGILQLLSYLVTLIGGASLFGAVRSQSPFDATVLDVAESARLTLALIVAFVGTIGAMILVGRTIKRPDQS